MFGINSDLNELINIW
jgi:hypothetical protein